jgi:ribose transport system permease protein
MGLKVLSKSFDQERIVLAIAVLLFVCFAVTLDRFIDPGNLLSLLQGVLIIGVLGVAMAIVVIGRGIDLSMIAVTCMPVAWFVVQVQAGTSVEWAVLSALAIALVVGLLNGWLIAYAGIPSIFATIATGTITCGAVQFFFVPTDIIPFPPALKQLSQLWISRIYGVPTTVIFFAVVAAGAWFFLRYTRSGRFIYAVGDNPAAARITGLPVRPILMLQYVVASVIALVAGIILASAITGARSQQPLLRDRSSLSRVKDDSSPTSVDGARADPPLSIPNLQQRPSSSTCGTRA